MGVIFFIISYRLIKDEGLTNVIKNAIISSMKNYIKLIIGMFVFGFIFIIQTHFASANTVPLCTISNFSASLTSIESGDFTVLSWDTSNCFSLRLSNVGVVSNFSYMVVWPSETTTYTLSASGLYGAAQAQKITINVDESNSICSISNFSITDTEIEEGGYTTLKWNTTNCFKIKISNVGYVGEDGSAKVYPNEDTTYILTAYNSDGSKETETVKINVNGSYDIKCSIDKFTASDMNINIGDSVVLKWNTSDCDNIEVSNYGSVSSDGSMTVYPSNSIIYTLRAYGQNDSDLKSIKVNVNDNQNIINQPIYNKIISTKTATNVSQTGAQFNGLVTSSNYSNVNVHFEYGKTVNMGTSTITRSTNGNTNFSEYLANLNPNTIYFFQAVSEGPDGVSRGAIEVFQTLPYINTVINSTNTINTTNNTSTTNTDTTKTVVTEGTTVLTKESPVVLKIENRYKTIGKGDIVDYVLTYKNIGDFKLTGPMIQVHLPKGITVVNNSTGTYSEEDRTLSVALEDLSANTEGTISLQGRVDSIDSNLTQIVTTAILIYTNINGAQENAMAYVLNNPKTNGSVLGASAASSIYGNILGMSLIELLIIVIVILLLICLARSFLSRHKTVNK